MLSRLDKSRHSRLDKFIEAISRHSRLDISIESSSTLRKPSLEVIKSRRGLNRSIESRQRRICSPSACLVYHHNKR
jgi:hypothetical protein